MKKCDIDELYQSFLCKRPAVEGAYAYGSGAFYQVGYEDQKKPLRDLIIVVDDVNAWHEKNVIQNPNDYNNSSRSFIHKSEKRYKGRTGITFFPYIKDNGEEFKMGVVSKEQLLNDLNCWESFYLAGRFQKPIAVIKGNELVDVSNVENRRNALALSLYMKGEKEIRDIELLEQVCSLSFKGDIRMGFMENPKKVSNIVLGSYDRFKEIYLEDTYSDLVKYDLKSGMVFMNYKAVLNIVKNIPGKLLTRREQEGILFTNPEIVRKKMEQRLSSKNFVSSTLQPIKQIQCIGAIDSVRYGYAKFQKGRK